jgi:hypothetical protein
MAVGMVFWSRVLFKAPLSIIRITLSIFLVIFVGMHLSKLFIPAMASKCRPLTKSKNLYPQAIFVAAVAMALGIWSMVTISKN